MQQVARGIGGPVVVVAVAVAVTALASAVRALGFGDGVLLGAPRPRQWR